MRTTKRAVNTWPALHAAYGAAFKVLERALAPVGVTLPQLQALQLLATGPQPVTAVRLADALALEGQSVTGLVDRMEQQGWVVRLRDLPDRRAIRLQLTDMGHSVLLDATAVGDAALTQLFAGLRPAELGLLARLLGRAYEQAIAIRVAHAPLEERGPVS